MFYCFWKIQTLQRILTRVFESFHFLISVLFHLKVRTKLQDKHVIWNPAWKLTFSGVVWQSWGHICLYAKPVDVRVYFPKLINRQTISWGTLKNHVHAPSSSDIGILGRASPFCGLCRKQDTNGNHNFLVGDHFILSVLKWCVTIIDEESNNIWRANKIHVSIEMNMKHKIDKDTYFQWCVYWWVHLVRDGFLALMPGCLIFSLWMLGLFWINT